MVAGEVEKEEYWKECLRGRTNAQYGVGYVCIEEMVRC